ncbi:hypothetical protein [Polyangium jinanense]|uniref:Uncharacterized protein n=1 Tax=Polyangium jinanense TaxID=2829994 RepID=A0A9X3X180_9BACT|nr:hypothetical protein [Polyangium jinanense]MDC3955600.1 hypothetical protein [Polyangium jinanense]MDC3982242.1 hypothetical protein [Polyangium jinanense]
MTVEALRRVGTLRLQARREELVRRGALLFEDALRTASLPGAGPGRVLLLRWLDIGVIRADMPPASVALALEQRVRALVSSAVHGEEPGAERAEVVFFRDEIEPFVALARRLGRGGRADAWFWPHAAPGFVPGMGREEALRFALRGVMETGAGPLAAAALVEALFSTRGALEPLLFVLRWQEGSALVRSLGGMTAEARPFVQTDSMNAAAPSIRTKSFRETIARFAASWGPSDARSVWLTAMFLLIEEPGRIADPRLAERAAAVATAIVATNGDPQERGQTTTKDEAVAESPLAAPAPAGEVVETNSAGGRVEFKGKPARDAAEETDGASVGVAGEPRPEKPRPGGPREGGGLSEASPRGVSDEPAAAARIAGLSGFAKGALVGKVSPDTADEEPWATGGWGDGILRPTVVGGLSFLIPVLEQIGISARLEADPRLFDVGLAARFFVSVARRFGAPAEDAAFLALGGDRVDASFEDPALGEEVERLVRELLLEARRFCRRNLRLGLRDLVCRPGRIGSTRTHIDVVFDLEAVDIRVRRAGLDLDPGWVPWLGRVVRYHYLHGADA